MYLYNGILHTMTGSPPENGYLRIEGAVITEIGTGSFSPPAGEIAVDLQGQAVYPGFVDAHTHLGMWEDGLDFEGADGNEETDPVTPQLRVIDGINPMDRCFTEALDSGVTTAVVCPGSANAIAGQIAAVKTSGCRIDKMLLKAPLAIKMALGENPKTVYHGKEEAPMTRMATVALIREQLIKAQDYKAALEKYEASLANPEGEPEEKPEFDAKCDALLPALRREIQVHFHAHRADDIFTAMRIGKEFSLDYVIVHTTEGHLIAQELQEEQVKVLSGPFLSDRSKPELRNLSVTTPKVLSEAGLRPAIITDHPVVPLQYLRLCAGLAAAEGMDREEALRAITIYPAQICGLADRIGSIAVGKDADLTVFAQDPLQLGVKPTMVFVNGKQVR